MRGDAAAVHLPDQSVGAIRRSVRHVRAHRGGVRLRVGCEPVGRQERLPQVDGVGGSIPVGAIPGGFCFCLCLCFRFRRRVVVAGAAASSRELALGERGDEVGEGAKGGFPPRANVRVKGERHLRGPPGPHAVPHERLHRDRRRDDVRVERLAEQGVRLVEHPGGAQRVEEPRDEGGFVAQACAQPSRGGSRGGERAEDGAGLPPELRGGRGPRRGGPARAARGARNLIIPARAPGRLAPRRPRGRGRRDARAIVPRHVGDVPIAPSLPRAVVVVPGPGVGVRPARRAERRGEPRARRETWPNPEAATAIVGAPASSGRARRSTVAADARSARVVRSARRRRSRPGPGPPADASGHPPAPYHPGGHVYTRRPPPMSGQPSRGSSKEPEGSRFDPWQGSLQKNFQIRSPFLTFARDRGNNVRLFVFSEGNAIFAFRLASASHNDHGAHRLQPLRRYRHVLLRRRGRRRDGARGRGRPLD